MLNRFAIGQFWLLVWFGKKNSRSHFKLILHCLIGSGLIGTGLIGSGLIGSGIMKNIFGVSFV